MIYYKATRPDGTDFHTGTVNYAGALASGETIRHPAERVKDRPGTYLSVSIAPADCTGAQWPCRLFRVKPVGRALKASDLPNKRACSALRVAEELPAWLTLGPNGQQVAALIEQARGTTPEQATRLRAAWRPVRSAQLARSRVGKSAQDAAGGAARNAAWIAAWGAARNAAGDAAGGVAWAYVTRDLITPEQFQLLAGPWISVMGEPS